MEKLIITPKTKVYDLLEAYPQLEEVLIDIAPEFKKLKNPVLRRTIARVTSLAQAAVVGNVPVDKIVNRLREAVGQQGGDTQSADELQYNTTAPEWFGHEHVSGFIDIGEMLDRGEQPVHEVLSALKKLEGRNVIEVKAPFIPAPLIDKATGLGYNHWVQKRGNDTYMVFFSKEK
jgi:hypothetical protein